MSTVRTYGTFVCLLLLAACGTLSSGHRYTLTRVAEDQSLTPAHRLTSPESHSGDGSRIQDGEYLRLTLKGGYLRYLEAVDSPEVVLFVKVRIRAQDQAREDSLVWEQVYLNSAESKQHIQLNKDSFLPRIDIPLAPAFEFHGEEITLELRIIELDQDDNQRVRSLVNAAASTAAVFRPESAASISVAQTVLSFLTRLNPDDIEFQCDFTLHPEATVQNRVVHRSRVTEQLTLQPRVGSYVLLKTEHPHRTYYPSTYFDLAHHGVRYAVAQTVKVGTLGICNWSLWNSAGADRDDDFYMQILGRPFGIAAEAWAEPHFTDGQLAVGSGPPLHYDGEVLVTRAGGVDQPFRDQSYLVLGIDRAKQGVRLDEKFAAEATKAEVDNLVQTGRLSPADFDAELQHLTASIRTEVFRGRIVRPVQEQLAQAKNPQEVAKALAGGESSVRALQAEERLKPDEAQHLLEDLRRRADARAATLAPTTTDTVRTTKGYVPMLPEGTRVEFVLEHPAELAPTTASANLEATTIPVRLTRLSNHQTRADCTLPQALSAATRIAVTVSGNGRTTNVPLWLTPPLPVGSVEVLRGTQSQVLGTDHWRSGDTIQIQFQGSPELAGVGPIVQSLTIAGSTALPIEVHLDSGYLRATNTSGADILLDALLRSKQVYSEPAQLVVPTPHPSDNR